MIPTLVLVLVGTGAATPAPKIGSASTKNVEDKNCDCHSTCTGNTLMFDCGAEEADRWTNPCLQEAFSSMPFCDESLSTERRVADLIKRIPDHEKLGSAGEIHDILH